MVAEVLGADAGWEAPSQRALLYRFFVGALLAGFTMVLSLAISTGYGFAAFRQLRSDIDMAHWMLLVAAVPALLLLGVPVVRGAFIDLMAGRLTLNVLFTLGTASAVGVSFFSYLRGTGPVYLETATMLLALYTLGRYLDAKAKGETIRVLGRLANVSTAFNRRLRPEPGEVAGDALRVGDHVQIRAGDMIPIDGRVRHGAGFVNESSLTGEARPARKQPGDAIFAGTANLDGLLTVEVTAVGEERRLAHLERMMRAALERPPRLASLTDRIMRWFIPAVIVLALGTFGLWFVLVGYEKALYAMIGDGVNDAAALVEADVGIALASGVGTAVEAADVTLYNPDLRNIVNLVRLSHRTNRTIRQNLVWTFGYNAVGLVLAVWGLLHPLAAVLVMIVSSAFVTWNALRIRRIPLRTSG